MSRAKYTGLCADCSRRSRSGADNPNWKGGVMHHKHYIRLLIRPDDFFYPMADFNGYVSEHRLIMAKHLGRCLQSWEFVHHKDGDGHNNDLSNLELTTVGSHSREHSKGYRDGYQQGLADGKNKRKEQEIRAKRELVEWLESLEFRGDLPLLGSYVDFDEKEEIQKLKGVSAFLIFRLEDWQALRKEVGLE